MDEAREHWIIGRALYEAITRLTGLPDERRPESDIEDMYELLNERYSDVLGAMVAREDDRLPPDPVVKLVPEGTPPEDDTTA
jgi:hypothetical protein